MWRFGVIAIVSLTLSLAHRKFFPQETFLPRTTRRRVRLSIFERWTGEFLLANVEIVAETDYRNLIYTFYAASGKSFDLDLSDADYRIVREKIRIGSD